MVECLTVGWLITTTGNIGELAITVDGEPVTGTEQDEGLFVSGFDGQTITVAWGAGTYTDTHSCGRESG